MSMQGFNLEIKLNISYANHNNLVTFKDATDYFKYFIRKLIIK